MRHQNEGDKPNQKEPYSAKIGEAEREPTNRVRKQCVTGENPVTKFSACQAAQAADQSTTQT
jgi:hypothetical protein